MERSDIIANRTPSVASASYRSEQDQHSSKSCSLRQPPRTKHTENVFPMSLGKIALTKAIVELARNAQNQNLILTYEALIVAHNILLFEMKGEI